MNKQLLSLFLTLSIGAMSFTLSGSIEVISPQPNDVFDICTGGSAKRFHADENCKGLRNSKCITKVPLDEAMNLYHRTPEMVTNSNRFSLDEAMNLYHRTPCQWCCTESASEDKQYDNWGD